jgi:hypothetical protein
MRPVANDRRTRTIEQKFISQYTVDGPVHIYNYSGRRVPQFHPDLPPHHGARNYSLSALPAATASGLESMTRSLDSHSFLNLKAYLLAARGVVFGAGVPWTIPTSGDLPQQEY